jgi:ABC-type cobalt transport system substrate-binding protein
MMMMMIVKMMMVMVMVMMTMTMTIFFAALWKEHFTGAFGSKREALISPQNINRT